MTLGVRSIYQVIDFATSGDSVTNDALGIQAQLSGLRSSKSEIWALEAPSGPIGVGMRVAPDIPHGSADDVLIAHVRDPDSPIWDFVASRVERIVLRVHGWQRPSSRPLKSVAARRSRSNEGDSPCDLIQTFQETLGRHRINQVAVLAVSSHTAALAAPVPRCATTVIIPPFFPYDEFVLIGQRTLTDAPSPPLAKIEELNRRSPRPADLVGPLILCIGRLEPHAEVEVLIAAMHLAATKGLEAALLTVVGRSSNPSYETALREFARDLRINVHFGGHCSQTHLLELMSTAAMVVSPSRSSGFGVRFVEAMAAGVPVIGRAAGALTETINSAGILLDPDDDVEVLAEAIVAVSTDTALRRRLVDQGLVRSTELTPARSAGLLHQFLDERFGRKA